MKKVIILGAVAIAAFCGYILNIVKLASCDFERPFKTEVVRIIGIPIGPVGVVIGFMSIGEENKK